MSANILKVVLLFQVLAFGSAKSFALARLVNAKWTESPFIMVINVNFKTDSISATFGLV